MCGAAGIVLDHTGCRVFEPVHGPAARIADAIAAFGRSRGDPAALPSPLPLAASVMQMSGANFFHWLAECVPRLLVLRDRVLASWAQAQGQGEGKDDGKGQGRGRGRAGRGQGQGRGQLRCCCDDAARAAASMTRLLGLSHRPTPTVRPAASATRVQRLLCPHGAHSRSLDP